MHEAAFGLVITLKLKLERNVGQKFALFAAIFCAIFSLPVFLPTPTERHLFSGLKRRGQILLEKTGLHFHDGKFDVDGESI